MLFGVKAVFQEDSKPRDDDTSFKGRMYQALVPDSPLLTHEQQLCVPLSSGGK